MFLNSNNIEMIYLKGDIAENNVDFIRAELEKGLLLNADTVDIVLSSDEDVNTDGIVDIFNLCLVSKYYNHIANDKEYSTNLDIKKDGVIDIYDIVRVSKRLSN